ncbi:MAG: hypothetical protein ABUL60_15545 [Myxococcales bacterium]
MTAAEISDQQNARTRRSLLGAGNPAIYARFAGTEAGLYTARNILDEGVGKRGRQRRDGLRVVADGVRELSTDEGQKARRPDALGVLPR